MVSLDQGVSSRAKTNRFLLEVIVTGPLRHQSTPSLSQTTTDHPLLAAAIAARLSAQHAAPPLPSDAPPPPPSGFLPPGEGGGQTSAAGLRGMGNERDRDRESGLCVFAFLSDSAGATDSVSPLCITPSFSTLSTAIRLRSPPFSVALPAFPPSSFLSSPPHLPSAHFACLFPSLPPLLPLLPLFVICLSPP
jgi:hypothetical protein